MCHCFTKLYIAFLEYVTYYDGFNVYTGHDFDHNL